MLNDYKVVSGTYVSFESQPFKIDWLSVMTSLKRDLESIKIRIKIPWNCDTVPEDVSADRPVCVMTLDVFQVL